MDEQGIVDFLVGEQDLSPFANSSLLTLPSTELHVHAEPSATCRRAAAAPVGARGRAGGVAGLFMGHEHVQCRASWLRAEPGLCAQSQACCQQRSCRS